jgi:hypothetical protein
MFGLFKSKKQRAVEFGRTIHKSMIAGAVQKRGVDISENDDVDDFCIQGSIAVGRIILNELGLNKGEGTEDDVFVTGVFVLGSGNYISYYMGENFEIISGVALVAFYGEEGVDDVGQLTSETINTYNELMTGNKLGTALMKCIASFFENAGDEQLEKLVGLFKVCRDHIVIKSE